MEIWGEGRGDQQPCRCLTGRSHPQALELLQQCIRGQEPVSWQIRPRNPGAHAGMYAKSERLMVEAVALCRVQLMVSEAQEWGVVGDAHGPGAFMDGRWADARCRAFFNKPLHNR